MSAPVWLTGRAPGLPAMRQVIGTHGRPYHDYDAPLNQHVGIVELMIPRRYSLYFGDGIADDLRIALSRSQLVAIRERIDALLATEVPHGY